MWHHSPGDTLRKSLLKQNGRGYRAFVLLGLIVLSGARQRESSTGLCLRAFLNIRASTQSNHRKNRHGRGSCGTQGAAMRIPIHPVTLAARFHFLQRGQKTPACWPFFRRRPVK